MSFSGLFSTYTANTHEAVVDIGSHSIKAAIFSWDRARSMPRILKKVAAILPLAGGKMRVVSKLHDMLALMIQKTGVIPKRITVGIGPNLAEHAVALWSKGISIESSWVPHKEFAHTFKDLFSAHQEPAQSLFAYPVALFANGYAIPMKAIDEGRGVRFLPLQAHGSPKTIAFRTLTLRMPSEIGEALESAVNKWNGVSINFVPLALAYRDAFTQFPGARDALLIDIGGEETSLICLKEGVIVWMRSFPFGVHEIVRALAHGMKSSFREAENFLRNSLQGMDRNLRPARVQGIITEKSATWRERFIVALDEEYHHGPIEPEIFLTGGGALVAEIGAALRAVDWLKNFSPHTSPSVQIVAANRLFGGDSLGGFMGGPDDAGLAALIHSTAHAAPLFV